MMLKILKTDNEENVLVSLRIIIELHKHFRPSFNPEVSKVTLYLISWLTYINCFFGLPSKLGYQKSWQFGL